MSVLPVRDRELLGALVPEAVVVAAGGDVDADAEPLHPEEAEFIAGAAPARQAEFRSVRACARRALMQLAVPRPVMVPGPDGAPTWPAGVVGSMTHCPGYRAAAVAPCGRLRAVGIDAAADLGLPFRVVRHVALPEEIDDVLALTGAAPGIPWGRLLFSAKESVYKAWYAMTGTRCGIRSVGVRLDPGGGFTGILPAAVPAGGRPVPGRVAGRWLRADGILLTAAAVPAGSGAPPPEPPGTAGRGGGHRAGTGPGPVPGPSRAATGEDRPQPAAPATRPR